MADRPSDFELADMGDADIGKEDYRLAPVDPTPPPKEKLSYEVEHAMEKAEAEVQELPSPPLKPFQFTIRDMLIFTAVVAFLMGLIVSIIRGTSVTMIYLIFAIIMVAVWFGVGLWEAGYWHKRKTTGEDGPPPDEFEVTPIVKQAGQPLQYSVVKLILLVAVFAFLISLSTFLPGQNKLSNVAGMSGLCSLLGLVWLAFNEPRHPMFLMFWWLMFLMYLLSSLAVVIMG
jgi:hypothetical protein